MLWVDDLRSGSLRLRAALAVVVATLLSVGAAEASRFGRSGFSGNPDTNGGSVCTVCHAPGGAPAASIVITGPAQIDAGSTARYSLTLTGAAAFSGGVNLSVSGGAGRLAPAPGDDRLGLVEGELAHSVPQPLDAAGRLTVEFSWQAPNYDTEVLLYAAGNATNGKLDLFGDAVATTVHAVRVVNGFEPPPPPPPPVEPALIALEKLVDGLVTPVAVTNAGDARLFVVEQAGAIRVIDDRGSLLARPFLDIRNRVKLGGSEQGMLGLAFHPDYAENGFFYVNYIVDLGDGEERTRVSRFRVSSDPDRADEASERVLMEFQQPYGNHNGGDLHFGPDKLLYIASGDGGNGGDPQDYAQNPNTLLGKILRIDVDTQPGRDNGPDCALGGSGYAIPRSNAYTDGDGGAGCDEIFALGVRNPWRISFDRLTGDLWVADVGQNRLEEVSVLPAGSAGGLNLGWRCYEGSEPFDLRQCNRSYLAPVFDYPHSGGNCSITGGFVYRGPAFPTLYGQYFFSDFCNPAVRSLSGPRNTLVETEALSAGEVLFASFGEDLRGELYGADFVGGAIYRLVAKRATDRCEPGSLTLPAQTLLPGAHRFRSGVSVTTLGEVRVSRGAALELAAPRVSMGPGFRVEAGAYLSASASAIDCSSAAEPTAVAQRSRERRAALDIPSAPQYVAALGPTSLADADALPADILALLSSLGIEPGAIDVVLLGAGGHWLIVETSQPLRTEDTNGVSDLYRIDSLTGRILLISQTPAGGAGNGPSRYAAADASGELIVFESQADDLVDADHNQASDIFLHDSAVRTTVRVSDGNGASAHPSIDVSGTDLVYDQRGGDGRRAVLVARLASAQAPVMLSLPEGPKGSALDNHHPAISADGRYVAYLEESTGHLGEPCRVHLYDRVTQVYHLQVCPEALADASKAARPSFSADGTAVHWSRSGRPEPVVLGNPLRQ